MAQVPANPEAKWQLSPQEQEARADHREWIGGRALTLLSHYWREDDDDALTAAIGKDWADVLEGIPAKYIQQACIRYQQQEPRRKPTPGAIYQLAKEAMPAPKVVRRSEPIAQPNVDAPCDPEVAQRICEEAGFTPKRFGGTDV